MIFSNNMIICLAEKTFKEFGEMLKRLRQFDDYEVMTSYLSTRDDPAKQDSELRQKLQDNATLNKKREQEVFCFYLVKTMEPKNKYLFFFFPSFFSSQK